MTTYITLDEGETAFEVMVRPIVYASPTDDNRQMTLYRVRVATLDCEWPFTNTRQVFVSESPRNETTDILGRHGPAYDGNSILIHIDEFRYVFIGFRMLFVTTNSPVVYFCSPIGEGDVAYPWAKLANDDVILFAESVIMSGYEWPQDLRQSAPYSIYYDEADQETPTVSYFLRTTLIYDTRDD